MFVFFFKQKPTYEMRISDLSSYVSSSDLESRSPCPCLPCFRADDRFCPQYYKNGQNKAARDACLDETGKITASVLRRMFADINGRASIFPAKSEPLNNTQTNDDDWRSGTDRRFGRNEAHGRRSKAHERAGHEES